MRRRRPKTRRRYTRRTRLRRTQVSFPSILVLRGERKRERERERESRKVSSCLVIKKHTSKTCKNAHYHFTSVSYLSKTPARSSPRFHRATRIASRSRTRKIHFLCRARRLRPCSMMMTLLLCREKMMMIAVRERKKRSQKVSSKRRLFFFSLDFKP